MMKEETTAVATRTATVTVEKPEAAPTITVEVMDFDAMEMALEAKLEGQFAQLEILEKERAKINNPEALGETIQKVVWEQFMNQIGAQAGEDFIEENRGLTLDLRDEAHIQTTENFANGNIATHNTNIDYQARYDKWNANFQHDEQGNKILDTHSRMQEKPYKLVKGAREAYDKDRPKGSGSVAVDHTVAAAEIIRDPEAGAHLTESEKIGFANSPENLHELDAAANCSKSDIPMKEWLEMERDGVKNKDRFNIDEQECLENDRIAREEYEKVKAEGKKKSLEAGKASQKAELKRISGEALRSALMRMLANLVKKVMGKVVKWFRASKRTFDELSSYIKEALEEFIGNLKNEIIEAGDSVFTTIATSIFGPIVRLIKSIWTILKTGWQSLKQAYNYIKDPANKDKPFDILLMEVGKIFIAAISAGSAVALGEVIEKALMTFPVMAIEIPLLGSMANIIGMLMGGLLSGIAGAIAIKYIDKLIAHKQERKNVQAQLAQGKEILATQNQLQAVTEAKLARDKETTLSNIKERHEQAAAMAHDVLSEVCQPDRPQRRVEKVDHSKDFADMDDALDGLAFD